MLSLFCVPVSVVAQPSNNAVHRAVIVASKICLNGFIGCIPDVVNSFLTNALKDIPVVICGPFSSFSSMKPFFLKSYFR